MRVFQRVNPDGPSCLEDEECLVVLGRRCTWIYYPGRDLWMVITDRTSPEALRRKGRIAAEGPW